MTDWQPIDKAPKDGTRFLLTDGNNVTCGYIYKNPACKDYPDFMKVDDGDILDWTDWKSRFKYMPLPELPSKKHYCERMALTCQEDDENKLYISFPVYDDSWGTKYYTSMVNYCPICGERNNESNI